MNAFRKFIALSWMEQLILFEALFYLGLARLALLTVPFKYIAPHLGQQMEQKDIQKSSLSPSGIARQIAWAVDVMSRRTPWESACLAQAIAGKFMLKRRSLTSWLYLGTKKDDADKFIAHAWLQSGNEILLGGAGSESFTALSVFSD